MSSKTLEKVLMAGRLFLKEKNIVDGDIDAWYLMSDYFQISRTEYLSNSSTLVKDEDYNNYMKLINLRASHIPLQYITKEQEFMGLEFLVSPDVLIPRQDTEVLVEEILKASSGKDVLDICTGSGCIIISLSKLGNIKNGVGVDISEKALSIAKANGEAHNVNVTFIQSDLFTNVTGKYDIIVSNPPYIPSKDIEELMEEVKLHEPRLALDGKEDGLYFYRNIIEELPRYLNPGGEVYFEIGYNQGDIVSELLRMKGFTKIKVIKDLAGLNRVVKGTYDNYEEHFT